ncbi:hypothetical protein GC197_06280 [bacterium]|nr:hypothetical protein [bacterium]
MMSHAGCFGLMFWLSCVAGLNSGLANVILERIGLSPSDASDWSKVIGGLSAVLAFFYIPLFASLIQRPWWPCCVKGGDVHFVYDRVALAMALAIPNIFALDCAFGLMLGPLFKPGIFSPVVDGLIIFIVNGPVSLWVALMLGDLEVTLVSRR